MDRTYSPSDVDAYENATWSRCAPTYDAGFAALMREAVPELLDAAAVGRGSRVLDVGTGTGVAAAAARDREAHVTGIDFSPAMITEAERHVPGAVFHVASADSLPYPDGAFDAVIANGVLHHLGRPDRALTEAGRVLAPRGRVACTVWDAPEKLDAFGLFLAAVEEHVGSADLPHGPLFGVTDADTLTGLFTDAGFTEPTVTSVPSTWRMGSIDTLLDAFGAWADWSRFATDARERITATVRDRATAYTTSEGSVAVPNPMLLIAASAPGD